ncbi:MAG TPA: 3-deoxy-D-manno-octulosonic acid transferase [Xanthobacteraceae bacterium]|nr:3-deoxy-D-manno-octulosonic acid transferase [Xanthobacteraceae bacterium]
MPERLPLTLGAYRLLARAATPFAASLLSYRLGRGKEDPARIAERRGTAGARRPAGPLVWVHGASVGELLAVVPLIERIRAQNFSVLVTSGTVTSAGLAAQRLPRGVVHQFVPLDIPSYVTRFLDHWRPDLALFVESDLWPNLIVSTSRRRIPLILVNGRLSQRSFERWRHLPGTIADLLGRFDLCLVRSTADAERYDQLGAPRIATTGNLKLDVPELPVDPAKLAALRTAIGSRPRLAASSTHPGEEAAVIEAHRRLAPRAPGLLSVVAPRHPDRGVAIAEAAASAGLNARLRSRGELPDRATHVYVCDTLGELGLIYRLCPVVFMGGSLVPHGGQNPIEAVKLGAAVLHGPHVGNFAEIYAALDANEGAAMVDDAAQLAARASALLRDPARRERVVAAAQRSVTALAGALERTLSALEPYLLQIRLEQRSGHA